MPCGQPLIVDTHCKGPPLNDVHQRHGAGPAIHKHLDAVMPPLLAAAEPEERAPEGGVGRAAEAALRVAAGAVAEDGVYLLVAQLIKVCMKSFESIWFQSLYNILYNSENGACLLAQQYLPDHVPTIKNLITHDWEAT